jgi:hypothetical protein
LDPDLIKTVEADREFFHQLHPDLTLTNIFIGSRFEPEGTIFGALWFLTPTLLCVVPDFAATRERQYTILSIRNIRNLSLRVRNLDPPDFNTATDSTRLDVQFQTPTAVSSMGAVGQNCKQLYEATKRFLVPHLASD